MRAEAMNIKGSYVLGLATAKQVGVQAVKEAKDMLAKLYGTLTEVRVSPLEVQFTKDGKVVGRVANLKVGNKFTGNAFVTVYPNN